MINVKTGEFFGPFDLLLDLIKSSKYDIYDIKISDITNKYIESLKDLEIPADETADFILIATQLLYLKTKSLLKDTIVEDDNDEDIISKEELIDRLNRYKTIKSIIPKIRELEDEGLKKHVKHQEDLSIFDTSNDMEIFFDIERLKQNLEILIDRLVNVDEFKVDAILNREEYSLEEYNASIKIKLIKERFISISKMLKTVKSKSEAIIIFLSILELAKTNDLVINQDINTLDISINIREEKYE